MQTDNRFLDDLAKLANSALGTLQGVREEIEVLIRQRVERLISDLDLIGREEFEAVQAMAAKARAENEALGKRIAKLEGGAKRKSGARTTAKTTAKTTARKKPAAPGKKKPGGGRTAKKG